MAESSESSIKRAPITREAALEILRPFQVAMVESPPPWLLKVLSVHAEKRLKNYSAAEVAE